MLVHFAFKTFRRRGTLFLAVPVDSNGDVAVMDEFGNNFGRFQTVEAFLKGYELGAWYALGKCYPRLIPGDNPAGTKQ
jgi:hypothetical protein